MYVHVCIYIILYIYIYKVLGPPSAGLSYRPVCFPVVGLGGAGAGFELP